MNFQIRIIDKQKINELLVSSKNIEIHKIFKTEHINVYDEFLNNNTQIVTELLESGFVIFSDIIDFLKDIKGINFHKNIILEKYSEEIYNNREEYVFFADKNTADEIISQYKNVSVTADDIKEFNIKNVGEIMEDSVHEQINQINIFIAALKKVSADKILFVRDVIIR